MNWRNSAAKTLTPFAALWAVHESRRAQLRALAVQAGLIALVIWASDRVLAYFGDHPPHDLSYLLPGFIGGVIGLILAGSLAGKGPKP